MKDYIRRFDIRVSLSYAIIALLWIFVSDTFVSLLFDKNHFLQEIASLYKGFGFVIVTTLALFFVLSGEIRKRTRVERELMLERDISPTAIITFDSNGVISYANIQAEKILGKPRNEIVGALYNAPSWHVTDHNGNPIAEDYEHLSKLLEAHQTVFGIQQAVEVVKGKRVLLDINLAPLVNEMGEVTGALATFSDVTMAKVLERQLVESEARYRTLVEHASDGIFVSDSEGRYVDVNSAFCTLLGYSKEEILQKDIQNLMMSSTNTPMPLEQLRQGKAILSERQLKRTNGTVVTIEISSKQLMDGSLQGIVRDITERRRAEEELHLKSVALESAANGIVITDLTGTIRWANPAFTTMTGYLIEEAQGRNPGDLLHSGKHDALFYEEMWNTILNGGVWHGEIINRRKDSSLYTEEMTITPVRDKEGKIDHFIAIKQDITARKLIEEALQRSNTELEERVAERTTQINIIKNRIESILNSSPDSIIYCHTDGRIEQINPAFSQIFGYGSDEIFSLPLSKLVISDDIHQLEKALEGVISSKQVRQLDVSAINKSGDTFDAGLMLAPVIKTHNELNGIVLTIRDITQRKRLLNEAMHLSELKSRYVAMAAHDLRNPLAVILTSSDTLQNYYDRLSEEKRLAKFNQIKAKVKVMTEILEDILIVGEADSGKITFSPMPLDVKTFCDELIQEIMLTLQTTIQIEFSTNVTQNMVSLDAKLLRHILVNLLSNAIKYSGEANSVNFSVRDMGNSIEFTIQDHGIGIPKSEQEHLFETFYRASNAKVVRGTGLGLAIVKRSTELHHGSIAFDSEVGQGSTFVVTLPTAL
ncbi:MAG: PAS domain S-box protein [Anaerolineae bacterium]